jgi:hypothetical protein
VDKKAIEYLRAYWTEPPRKYRGAIHTRYMSSYGVGQLTSSRPKLRKYIVDNCRASSINETGKGVELCMHMRLECFGLNAFHRHRRQGESLDTQSNRELCPCCHQGLETPTHFPLECPAYSSPWSVLLAGAIADAQFISENGPAPAQVGPDPSGPAPDAPTPTNSAPALSGRARRTSPRRGQALGSPAPSGPALDGLGPGGPAPSGSIHNNSALGGPAPGGPTVLPETWRIILARMQPGVIKFVQDAWYIRRAVLTGRGADGGNPMALPPVP